MRRFAGTIRGNASKGIPDTINGLVAWHRFDVADFLILDGANNVLEATDLSGNNNNFIEGGLNYPVFSPGFIQGGSLFAVNNHFFIPEFECFYVINRNNTVSSANILATKQGAGTSVYRIGIHPTVFRAQLIAPSYSFTSTNATALNAFQLHNWSHLAGVNYVSLQNLAEQSNAGPSPNSDSSRDNTAFGSNVDFQYKEIILYNRRLTSSERQEVKNYLNSKYSLF